jgi:hypothetical protein
MDPQAITTIEGFMGEYKYKPDSDKPLKNDIHDPVMDAFRYIAYQNYSLSGDHMRGESRIQMFGKKGTTHGDESNGGNETPDGTKRRSFSNRGWTTTVYEQSQPIRSGSSWTRKLHGDSK